MFRRVSAVLLSTALAVLPVTSIAAPASGVVQGTVTVEGQPLAGMGLALVDLKSGAIHRTKSNAKGGFRLDLAPGDYVVTSTSLAGLSVGRAPSRVVVEAGRIASTAIDLARLGITLPQEPPAGGPQTPGPSQGPQQYGNITHEPIGCLVAGQFPEIDASIENAANVARARVYFKSALGDAYYFVEMVLEDGTVIFKGKLPKPKVEASPITYYIQVVTTDFGENQTPEIAALVVADESECPEGVRVAPIGPPGAVTVFSAATASIAVPAGFAAGGLAIAGGTILLVVGGAAIATGVAVGVTNDETTTTTTTTPATTPTTTTTLPPVVTTTTTTTLPEASPSPASPFALPSTTTFPPISLPPSLD